MQSTSISDIRVNGIDDMPNWNEKRALSAMSQWLHMFPAVIANPGFVSIKIETLSKVIKDIRRMFQMFETKPNYLKSTIETLEQGVKYFQS